MSLQDIIIKIALFFVLFYGAVAITSIISKQLRSSDKESEKKK